MICFNCREKLGIVYLVKDGNKFCCSHCRDEYDLRQQNTGTAPASQLITPRVVSKMLAVSIGTLKRWRHTGAGPPYVKFGGLQQGHVRYRLTDVEAYIEKNLNGKEFK